MFLRFQKLIKPLQNWLWWGLLILAVVWRVWNFGHNPVSLYWDEMSIWSEAQSIAQTGADTHGRSWLQPLFIAYGDYKLPGYIWMTSLVANVTSNYLVGARVISLLSGLSFIPLIYLLTWQNFKNKQFSKLAALAMAWLPWSLHFSRVGFESHFAAALLSWSIFLLLWLKKVHHFRSKLWLSLGIWIFASFAFYTYFSVRYVWPVLFITVIILWWPKYKKLWPFWLGIFLAWLLAMAPMFLGDFYSASNQIRLSTDSVLNQPDQVNVINWYRLQAGNGGWTKFLYNHWSFSGLALFKNLGQFFTPDFLFWHGDGNLRHGVGQVGILWFSWLPLVMIGLVSLWNKSKRWFMLLAMWWLLALVPAAVPNGVPHALRSLNGVIVWPVVVAYGASQLIAYLRASKKIWLWFLAFFWGLIWIWEAIIIGVYTFTLYPIESAPAWQDGYHQLAKFISQEQGGLAQIWVDIKDDRFFLYYQVESGLSWQEIQAMPTTDFRRERYPHVRLDSVEQMPIGESEILIIRRIDEPLPEAQLVRTIQGDDGRDLFLVYR